MIHMFCCILSLIAIQAIPLQADEKAPLVSLVQSQESEIHAVNEEKATPKETEPSALARCETSNKKIRKIKKKAKLASQEKEVEKDSVLACKKCE